MSQIFRRASEALLPLWIGLGVAVILGGAPAEGSERHPRRTRLQASTIQLPTSPADLTTADFDGDGNADLAIAAGSNQVLLYPGRGDGTFRTNAPALIGPRRPAALKAGDFDGDGNADLAIRGYDSETNVTLWLGDGALGFVPGTRVVGPFSFEMIGADFDGNGTPDLVLGGPGVTVLLSDGAGGLTSVPVSTAPNANVATGDFNGDGNVDIVANEGHIVSVYPGDGFGGFAPGQTILRLQGRVIQAISPGTNEIMVSGYLASHSVFLELYRNGQLVQGTDGWATSFLRIDFDEDGTEDVLVGNTAYALRALVLDSGAPAIVANELLGGRYGDQAVAGDWNGDGHPDVASIVGYGSRRVLTILVNRTHEHLDLRKGNVSAATGSVQNVLLVNGSAGVGPKRNVSYSPTAPFDIRMQKPIRASMMDRVPYAAYAWPCEPSVNSVADLPFGIGQIALPIPLTGGNLQPSVIWNNAGRRALLGVPTRPSSGAAEVFFRRRFGLKQSVSFYIQGLIFDPGSTADVEASITNGVWVTPNG